MAKLIINHANPTWLQPSVICRPNNTNSRQQHHGLSLAVLAIEVLKGGHNSSCPISDLQKSNIHPAEPTYLGEFRPCGQAATLTNVIRTGQRGPAVLGLESHQSYFHHLILGAPFSVGQCSPHSLPTRATRKTGRRYLTARIRTPEHY